MSKKHFLTIGIPAFNEEKCLPQLIKSLNNIHIPDLSRIIVISDGSIDQTANIIKNIKVGNTRVTKIIDPVRKGKIYRLNQLFSLSKTEYLLILDADIQLEKNSVNHLVQSAIKNGSVLTIAHQIPLKPQSFIGKIIHTGYQMWDEMRTSDTKYLDHVENYYGAASLYNYCFYHKFRIPTGFNDERKFIYFSAKRAGKFIYDKSSLVYYHPVSTLRDFYLLGSRSTDIDAKIQDYFGVQIKKSFKIPAQHKFKVLLKYLYNKPFSTLAFICLKYIVRTFKTPDPLTSRGMWTIASSTKI